MSPARGGEGEAAAAAGAHGAMGIDLHCSAVVALAVLASPWSACSSSSIDIDIVIDSHTIVTCKNEGDILLIGSCAQSSGDDDERNRDAVVANQIESDRILTPRHACECHRPVGIGQYHSVVHWAVFAASVAGWERFLRRPHLRGAHHIGQSIGMQLQSF